MFRFLFSLGLIISPLITFGQNESWIVKRDSLFSHSSSTHFDLYVYEDYLSSDQRSELFLSREQAYFEICEFFETDIQLKVDLYFFPSVQSKYKITKHRGYGWGFDQTVVEVHNDSIKVDPYHELVHVIGYTLSTPPAIIDEGLAVYLSHQFADKPFSKILGYPDKSIHDLLAFLTKEERAIPLNELLSYQEIGEAPNPILAYVQSASFVAFLIKTYGKATFLNFYRSLKRDEPEQHKEMSLNFFGKELDKLEAMWLNVR